MGLTAIEVTFYRMMIGGGGSFGIKNRVYTMIITLVILCTIALGIVPSFGFIFFFCLFGIVMPMFNTPSTVLLQERLKVSLGRVRSVLSMISSIKMPLNVSI